VVSIVWRILAGLEAGVWGGVWMLVWMSLSTLWERGSFWSFPNLLASTFFGSRAITGRMGWMTLSGISLHLFVAGVLGTVFGLLALKLTKPRRVFLAGILFGLGWNYLASGVLWKKVNPLVPLYAPDGAVLFGHLLFGVFLGRLPRYLATVETHLRPAPSPGQIEAE